MLATPVVIDGFVKSPELELSTFRKLETFGLTSYEMASPAPLVKHIATTAHLPEAPDVKL